MTTIFLSSSLVTFSDLIVLTTLPTFLDFLVLDLGETTDFFVTLNWELRAFRALGLGVLLEVAVEEADDIISEVEATSMLHGEVELSLEIVDPLSETLKELGELISLREETGEKMLTSESSTDIDADGDLANVDVDGDELGAEHGECRGRSVVQSVCVAVATLESQCEFIVMSMLCCSESVEAAGDMLLQYSGAILCLNGTEQDGGTRYNPVLSTFWVALNVVEEEEVPHAGL